METVDTKFLIKKVKARPVLWDKFLETYMDRIATRDAWREVCEELNPNFESLDTKDQDAFRVEVFKRWKNLRDSYLKHKNKRINATKIYGTKAIKMRKYIYADQLSFLNKIYETRKSTDCMHEKEEDSAASSISSKTSTKHEKINDIGMQSLDIIREEKPCYKKTFLQSLMLHLEKFSNAEFLQFQVGALHLIQNINDVKMNSCDTENTERFPSNETTSVDSIIKPEQL